MPVEAASKAPTMMTEMASPPRRGPNIKVIISSNSSAIPDRSKMSPIRTKRGTAIRVILVINPQTLKGRREKRSSPKPIRPKKRAVEPMAKATWVPIRRRTVKEISIRMLKYSIKPLPLSQYRFRLEERFFCPER